MDAVDRDQKLEEIQRQYVDFLDDMVGFEIFTTWRRVLRYLSLRGIKAYTPMLLKLWSKRTDRDCA